MIRNSVLRENRNKFRDFDDSKQATTRGSVLRCGKIGLIVRLDKEYYRVSWQCVD